MSVSGPLLPLAGDGGVLCACLLRVDLLLAVLMVALIFLRPAVVPNADAAVT